MIKGLHVQKIILLLPQSPHCWITGSRGRIKQVAEKVFVPSLVVHHFLHIQIEPRINIMQPIPKPVKPIVLAKALLLSCIVPATIAKFAAINKEMEKRNIVPTIRSKVFITWIPSCLQWSARKPPSASRRVPEQIHHRESSWFALCESSYPAKSPGYQN